FMISANLVIILVVSRERTLHEPMYIFVALLSVNSLYGSTGFFPSFMISANLVIILVVSRERTLHEPMYIFVALLSVNSLYGSTGFFPSFMISANLVIILVVSRERTLHEPMYIFVALLSVNSLYGSTGFFPSFMISANLVIILVVSRERTLHEPMYIFVALLSVNSLYGSTGFFPRFLSDLLVDVHLMSRPECFTQIYVFYTYVSFEMTILGIIAYDRHVAVCSPLHYHTKMTRKTVVLLAASACILPLFTIALGLFLTVRLPLCDNKIQRVFCGNWNVVKLSCVSTNVNNIYGMFMTIIYYFPASIRLVHLCPDCGCLS
ncbi:unnamed protein product, partial [Tetraodon nigroviridis]